MQLSRAESEVDALTGLLNRRGWERFIEHEQARLQRFGDPASVVVLDLDGLKNVNDTAGHDAGDRLLRQTAQVLQETVRAADVVARLGGDEFGVIALVTSPDQATHLVDRLTRRLTESGISASIGHAPASVTVDLRQAQTNADESMYDNKQRRTR